MYEWIKVCKLKFRLLNEFAKAIQISPLMELKFDLVSNLCPKLFKMTMFASLNFQVL